MVAKKRKIVRSSKVKKIPIGTLRVEASSLSAFSKTKTGWRKIKRRFPQIEKIANLYKRSGQFFVLVDQNNPRFLKGQLSSESKEQGARIVTLPNKEKLEKAFSLFAPNLQLHDQDSHDHWDVLYQNKGGTWSYVYTEEKRNLHRAKKYKKVDKFAKRFETLDKNVKKALKNNKDMMAVPMYTLLHTYMRVGNETYYRAHGHKGLTTLQKGDLMIKGNMVRFTFLAKDGVPVSILKEFPELYVKRLRSLIRGKKVTDFVFSHNGHLLHENDFQKAFKQYCGEVFYPHIVRSFYASSTVKAALKSKKRWNKSERNELFLGIAHELGHKKFDKKTGVWNDNFAVTVKSYVQPELFEKINR
ncbi:hypothetical protein HOA92_05355 [archaeon]|jgi:hypothetical protein|nr:hypothetical protein [archaeon]MBT6762441.1 hypothetical protein [archaeon]